MQEPAIPLGLFKVNFTKVVKNAQNVSKTFKSLQISEFAGFFIFPVTIKFSKVPKVFGANSGHFALTQQSAPNLPQKHT